MHSNTIAAAAAFLALSACSGGNKKAESKTPLTNEQVAEKAAAAPKMQPGEYQTKSTLLDFDVPGLPASEAGSIKATMSGQFTRSHSYCLTEAETEQGPRDMVRHLAQSNCSVVKLDTSANSIKGEMQCSGGGGPNGTVTIDGSFSGDSSSMVMDMTQAMPGMAGKSMHMKMRVDSQRVGECNS